MIMIYNKIAKFNFIMALIIFGLMVLIQILTLKFCIDKMNKKDEVINNLQDEIQLLKEENKDVMDLNTQLMEELGYFNIEEGEE